MNKNFSVAIPFVVYKFVWYGVEKLDNLVPFQPIFPERPKLYLLSVTPFHYFAFHPTSSTVDDYYQMHLWSF